MRMLAAVATLLITTSAIAADDAAPKPAKPKKICKSTEPSTGSRMGARTICKTQAEWDGDRDATQRDLEQRTRVDTN